MSTEQAEMEPLLNFENAFEAIARSLVTASEQRSYLPAQEAAEHFGLKEQGDGRPSAATVWQRTEGTTSLWFRWRWWNQSHPFSIQPDMNELRLELRRGTSVLRLAEARYED